MEIELRIEREENGEYFVSVIGSGRGAICRNRRDVSDEIEDHLDRLDTAWEQGEWDDDDEEHKLTDDVEDDDDRQNDAG